MSTRYDGSRTPDPGADESYRALDVRDALADASAWNGTVDGHDPLDVDSYWATGRRRRARKRAGAAAVAGLAAVSTVAVVWSSGLLGGANDPEQSIAAVPDGMTTFVFAAPGAGAPAVDDPAVSVPDAGDLRGTSWVLLDDLWGSGGRAADVVGSSPSVTTLAFGAGDAQHLGWGITVDDCGGAWFQDNLTLSADGRFTASSPATHDQGCPDAAQTSEDFWLGALKQGGTLHEIEGGDWLLLSVNPALPDDQAAPTSAHDPTTSTTTGNLTTTPTQPTTPHGTAGEPTAPTTPTSTEPTAPNAPPGTEPTAPNAPTTPPPGDVDPGVAFSAPDEVVTHGDWLGGGGALLAPTVRAGVHDGFDRVVVDLTGTGSLGWRAAYTDAPTLDGSGQPADIAGDQVLEVWLSGMGYPEPGSDVYSEGTFGLDTHMLGAVVEVQRTTPFEGRLQLFVGMDGQPRPYRIFELDSPHRLVIDIQH